MKILKIQKLKNNKYKIYFDEDNIVLYDNVILENNLLYKKEIDKKTYNKILADNEYFEAYNDVIKFVSKKRHSEKEARDFMKKKKLSDIDKVINKLKDVNLINDIEYCKAFINDKIYLSKVGFNKIKKELLNQNISLDIIERELSKIDSDFIYDRLNNIIAKKIKLNKNNSSIVLKKKILVEMSNMGYDIDLIEELIDKNLNNYNDDYILEKEFNKIYNKLNKKYSDYELLNNIKQKLLLKGFDISKINDLLMQKKI